MHEAGQWIKFPHSIERLIANGIRQHRPKLAAILAEAQLSGPFARRSTASGNTRLVYRTPRDGG